MESLPSNDLEYSKSNTEVTRKSREDTQSVKSKSRKLKRKMPKTESTINFDIKDLAHNAPVVESDVSIEIKASAEVEKMWIIFDIDGSGELEFEEVRDYLRIMA